MTAMPAPPPPFDPDGDAPEEVPPPGAKLKKLGKIFFWSGYGASAGMGLILVSVGPVLGTLLGGHSSCTDGEECGGTKTAHYLPLFVPVAGPIWSLAYSDVNREYGNVVWFGATFLAQAAGITMYAIGKSAADEATPTTPPVSVSALPLPGGGSIVVHGAF